MPVIRLQNEQPNEIDSNSGVNVTESIPSDPRLYSKTNMATHDALHDPQQLPESPPPATSGSGEVATSMNQLPLPQPQLVDSVPAEVPHGSAEPLEQPPEQPPASSGDKRQVARLPFGLLPWTVPSTCSCLSMVWTHTCCM